MDAYDDLIESLALSEQGRAFVAADGTALRLALVEDEMSIIIEEISCTPTGTGLGTRVVERLAEYADEQGKSIEVHRPDNAAFWDRFSIPTL